MSASSSFSCQRSPGVARGRWATAEGLRDDVSMNSANERAVVELLSVVQYFEQFLLSLPVARGTGSYFRLRTENK